MSKVRFLILFLLCWGTLAARAATTASDTSFHFVCADPTAILTVDSAQSYHWSTNEATRSITVSNAGIYTVTSTHFDGNQTVDTFQVANIKTNKVSNISIPNMCAGGVYPITIGHDSINDIIIESHEASMVLSETIFLPDGVSCNPYGCSYRSPLTFTNFSENDIVTSVDDILYVRLNLEHSYAADLYINLTCPNGQKADILRFGGSSNSSCSSNIPLSSRGWLSGNNASGGTDFGLANITGDWDSNPDCTPTPSGTGWNYCWSNNSTYGYASGDGRIYRSANVHGGHFDSSNVANHSQFYHPDQSFQGLVGCPLNGSWYIEVMDGYSQNNGYLFEWELALASDVQTEYSDVVRTELDGPWVTTLSNSSFVITPPADLPYDTTVDYTFQFFNDYGCSYDTIVAATFFAKSQVIIDTIACDSLIWKGKTYRSDTSFLYKYKNIHGCDSLVTVNIHVFPTQAPSISGPYYFCPDSFAVLTASTAATYLWNTGDTTQSITVNEPGTYSVVVTDTNGCSPGSSATFQLSSADNPIVDAYLSDITAGDTLWGVMGTVVGDNLQYISPQTTLRRDETIFLPDGVPCDPYGCSYQASLDFTGFSDSTTITSANDIRYVRLKMEHSYIRDLYINLTCPNGQNAIILKKAITSSDAFGQCISNIPSDGRGWQSGSNVEGKVLLGYAYYYADNTDICNPNAPTNRPGTGWNYCWSNNDTEGFGYAPGDGSLIYRTANSHLRTVLGNSRKVVDSSDVAAGSQFYHPDESFDSLVGCPINGTWTVEVMDGLNHDNGYLFSWEISFGGQITQTEPPAVTQTHCTGPWITMLTDSTFFINPPDTLANDTVVGYTFTVINEIGCSYDTTVYINVYTNKITDLYDTVFVSELPFVWHGITFTGPDTKVTTSQTIHGLDSLIYMHLSVIYPFDTVVCANNLPLYWHGHTFMGADTVNLSYPVNDADSIEILAVSLMPIDIDTIPVFACFDFTWHGATYYQSGDYTFDTLNIHGCDSTVILHLTLFDLDTTHIPINACSSYTWHDSTYYQSGDYTFDTLNIHGCDSTVILHLSIFHPDTTDIPMSACEQYVWHDSTYYQSGDYTFDTINIHGCDSTVILHLSLFNTDTTHIPMSACEQYIWRDSTYYQSGDYTFDTLNIHGCDSTIILHLTLFNSDTTHIPVNACEYYTWHDSTYYQYGDYIFDTLTIHGCDSTVILHLSIFHPDTTEIPISACEHYTWHDSTYFQSGDYTFDTLTIHGCDSIVILHLTILEADQTSIFDTACGHFTWHDVTYYQSGDYSFDTLNIHGCDSSVILHLTIYPIPETHILGPAILCADSFAILAVDSGYTYLWNTGDTTRQVTITHPGLYSVLCRDSNSCEIIATHRVVLAHATPIAAMNIPTMCAGMDDTISIGYQTVSTIVLSSMEEDLPLDYDTITNVIHATLSGPWVSPIPNSDTAFLLSPPGTLLNDTTVHYALHLTDDFGCGYDTAFDILVHAHHLLPIDTIVCNAFTWNGITYTSSGLYKQPEIYPNGCTDTIVIQLTVNHSASSEDTLILVENDLPYYFAPTDTLFGIDSPSEFQFDYTIPSPHLCDSTVHQTVIIYWNIAQTFDTTVCANALPLSWHGHTFTGAGAVTDTMHTVHNSDSLVTLIVHVNSLAISTNIVTHVNCFGDSTGAVTATVAGGIAPYNYLWSNSSGTIISTTPTADHLPAGTYIFHVTDSLGCTAQNTENVNTLHAEMLPGSIASNQDVCNGDELQGFTGTVASGGDNSVYQWQIHSLDNAEWSEAPGIHNTQNYNFPQTVISSFSLRRAWISQSCGSRYSDTVVVHFWPTHRDTLTDHVCQNEPYTENGFNISADETSEPGLLTEENVYPTMHCDSIIVLLLTVNPTYEESFEDEVCEGSNYTGHGFYVNAIETIGTETLDKTLTLQSEQGCDSTLRLHLSIIDTAVHIVSYTPDFCEEMSTQLSVVTEMPDYVWSTGEQTTHITVTQPGVYSVTAYQGDCLSSSSFLIESCPFQIYLPNAISPLPADGLNDYFCIPEFYLRTINQFEISIFNRWGDQVFYSTDKQFKWDGEVKGKIYHNNVYSYVIRYTSNVGTPYMITGTVTVL